MLNKRKLKKVIGKSRVLKPIYSSVQAWRRKHYYNKVYKNIEVDDKLVLFESFLGKQYACSPKAIYLAMKSDPKYSDYKFVWVFRASDRMRKRLGDERTLVVKYNTRRYFRMLARAKYWVTNWRLPVCVTKKPEQVCIQTWHGTPLKKIGMDLSIEGNATTSQRKGHELYLNDAKKYDFFVSPSRFCTEVFSSAFGLNQLNKRNIVVETGYPRNDRLFTYSEEDCSHIREELRIPDGKKVLLYAPTWRDNQYTRGVGYSFCLNPEIEQFLRQVSDDYVVLLRMHYLVANSIDASDFKNVINVSKYEDINDLYLISDVLVTDYSSVFFDYANLKRPILFFMYDLHEYQENVRDFYIDLSTLPGPIVTSAKDAIAALADLNYLKRVYEKKYREFNETYNYLDDGHAGARVAEICIG